MLCVTHMLQSHSTKLRAVFFAKLESFEVARTQTPSSASCTGSSEQI